MFFYYYEESAPAHRSPASEIWLRCVRRAAGWTAWCGVCTVTIYVLGWIGYM